MEQKLSNNIQRSRANILPEWISPCESKCTFQLSLRCAGERQPAPSPRQALSLAPRTGGPKLEEFVREFVTSGKHNDPSVELGFYGESVDYFDDGRVGKAFIAEDIKKYNSRWPVRSYSVQGDPMVTVDSVRDTARAVVVLHFSPEQPEEHQRLVPKDHFDSRCEHESKGGFRCIEDYNPYRRGDAAIDQECLCEPCLSP
jgi:hypothetical protein